MEAGARRRPNPQNKGEGNELNAKVGPDTKRIKQGDSSCRRNENNKRHAKVWGVIPDLSNYPLDQQELVTAQIVHTLCMMLKESGND